MEWKQRKLDFIKRLNVSVFRRLAPFYDANGINCYSDLLPPFHIHISQFSILK